MLNNDKTLSFVCLLEADPVVFVFSPANGRDTHDASCLV